MQQYSISNAQIPSPPHNHDFINNNIGFREYHAQNNQVITSGKNTISWVDKYTNPQLLALQKQEQQIFGKPQSKSIQPSQQQSKTQKNNQINNQITKHQNNNKEILQEIQHSAQKQFKNQQVNLHINQEEKCKNHDNKELSNQKNYQALGNLSSENDGNIGNDQQNKTQKNKNVVLNQIKQVNEFSKLLQMSNQQLKAYLIQLMPDLSENVKDMTRQQLVQVIKDVLEDGSQNKNQNGLSENKNQNTKDFIGNLGYENQKLIERALKVYPQLKQYINTMSKSEIEDLLREVLEQDNKKDYSSNRSQNYEGQMMHYGYQTKLPKIYNENQMLRRGRPRMNTSYPEDMKLMEKPTNFKKPMCISEIIQNLIIQLPSLQNQIRKMCVKEIQQIYNQVMEQKKVLELKKKSNHPQQNNEIIYEDKKINNPIQLGAIRQNNLQGDTNIYSCQQYQSNYILNDNQNYTLKKDQINIKKYIKQNSHQDDKQPFRKQIQAEQIKQNNNRNIDKIQANKDGNCQKKVKSRTIIITHTAYNNSQNMDYGNNFEQITKKLLKIFQKS